LKGIDGYHIHLSFNNDQEAIELPILPETITIKQSGSNQTYDLLNIGEINVIKGLKLAGLTLESYFPVDSTHVTSTVLLKPMDYVETIQRWAATLRPIRLTMTGTIGLYLPVSIESFEFTEEGGAVGEISYKLELKQYLFYGPAKATIVNDTVVASTSRASDLVTPDTVVVKLNEDTFWILAKKYLNDETQAAALAALNGMRVDTVLFADQVIRLK